jgi:hypothetical protein
MTGGMRFGFYSLVFVAEEPCEAKQPCHWDALVFYYVITILLLEVYDRMDVLLKVEDSFIITYLPRYIHIIIGY